ncbi:hypothetical protein K440DRAFT_651668 [Wilcoxina mikolae CBS 423.85]|nr:hypothetical protein K440DRAFT_651668 [Wilcoxina mikolae CBS 423.85]
MSNVVVIYNQRRATIKTTPSKSLSEIRTEACSKFSIPTPSNFILKRSGTKLDLSLPVRLTGLSPGAKLDLVQTASTSAAISVVLRTVDPVEQLSGSFPPTTNIWGILRSFEQDARNAGRSNVNITERCAPSPGAGSGRLLYQMPAVRVANRELSKFDELRTTLQDLGCSGRELLVLRFLPTEIPYEDALMEIAGFPTETAVETGSSTPPSEPQKAVEKPSDVDTVMSETSQPPEVEESTQPANEATVPEPVERTSETPKPPASEEPALPVEPKIAVYQPSSSATPAAAAFDVPDSAFDIGIAELKKIKESYHIAAQPQRLLSDKEIAEKEAAYRQEMEKISVLRIKVRFPDGYTSQQELDGKCTARDLYIQIRSTLRHPNEPFILMIPPRDVIKDDARRLTIDLKLRSGASLHLAWNKEASEKAKNEPALKEELVKASKELPKPTPPSNTDYTDTDKDDDKGKGKRKDDSGSSKGARGDIEKKLKGLLRLGKK